MYIEAIFIIIKSLFFRSKPESKFQGVMVINRIVAFLLLFIYLSGSIAYSLPLASDIESCLSQNGATPCAEPFTLQDETFTNDAPIVAIVSTCYPTDKHVRRSDARARNYRFHP
jgi:hypothetical protein